MSRSTHALPAPVPDNSPATGADGIPQGLAGCAAERRELARALFLAAYNRHVTEIGLQLTRREAITGHVFSLLGSAFTLVVVSFTAGQAVKQPLIGLYGAAAAALLVPILMLFLFAKHKHADLRVGQLAVWIRLHFEPLLPSGAGWDSHRREMFPDRPWLRADGGDQPTLTQPRDLQRRATRLLIAVIDALTLGIGGASLAATVAIGPGWTVLVLIAAGVPLFAVAATTAGLTLIITRHARHHPSSE
jgi:hypothetical protein